MKKKILTFLLLLLILLILFSSNCSASSSTGKTFFYKDENRGILAYKQVNAFQLQLANGTVLSNMSVSSESSVDIEENMKDVEIVFVLDNSGSMGGNRIQTLRTATQELVNKLFDKIGEDHLKFGFVKFDDSILGTLSLTDNKSVISSFISGMKDRGGTNMSGPMNEAFTILNASSNSDAIKMIITLSDGVLWDEDDTIKNFKKVHSAGISTISIFVETSITPAFSDLANNSSSHKNMQTSTSNMADTLVNGIYSEIYMKVILLSDPTTNLDLNNAGIIPGDDKIIIQIDSEIMHGATLYIEYIISVTCAFDATNITISDYPDSSLKYNKNQRLLTENKKNSDYNWTYTNGYITSNSGSGVIRAGTEYKKKIILSTVLTSAVLNNSSSFCNYVNISLVNNTEHYSINIDQAQDGGKLRALGFLIVPPFGTDSTTIGSSANIFNIILVNASIVVFFTCSFVLFYIFIKIKKNKRKVKNK